MGERILNDRSTVGGDVRLVWNRTEKGDNLMVVVEDRQEAFVVPATPDNALDVFYHPYARAETSTPKASSKMERWNKALDNLNSLFPLDRSEVLTTLANNELFGSVAVVMELVEQQKEKSDWQYPEAA